MSRTAFSSTGQKQIVWKRVQALGTVCATTRSKNKTKIPAECKVALIAYLKLRL